MSKKPHKSISVKTVNITRLLEEVGSQPLAVGVDVAKSKFYASLMLPDGQVQLTVKWDHPAETRNFVALLARFPADKVRVALESTSRYGDILVAQLREAGIAVHNANTKRVHDAAEVYDGVPSKHDAKDAAVIADLLLRGKTRALRAPSPQERRLQSLCHLFLVFKDRQAAGVNRLEAELARFWPELPEHLALQSISLLTLLKEYGVPEAVAAAPGEAKALLRATSKYALSDAYIDTIVASAATTEGCSALPEERHLVQMLAEDALRATRDAQAAEGRLKAAAAEIPSVLRQAKVIGETTAAVVVAKSGDVGMFASPASYVKNLGLNLKENSSGKGGQRGVALSKRGEGRSRKHLYLAALRLLQQNPIIKAWYEYQTKTLKRVKMKVIVALMRKVTKALWYVARGDAFDAEKLFDTRLFMNATASEQATPANEEAA